MADVKFNQRFPVADATRGSWVPIDDSTITGGITSSSRGKYAQLNYIIGSEPGSLNLALSGGTVVLPVSTVNIEEPLEVINQPGTRLDVDIQQPVNVTVQEPLSTTITNQTLGVNICAGDIELSNVAVNNLDQVSSVYVNNLEQVSAVNATIIEVDTTVYSSVTVPATGLASISFVPNVTILELYNNDTSLPVYVGFNNVGLASLSANALPLVAEGFYSIDRDTSGVYIGNVDPVNDIDVRIIGHRKA